MAELYKSGNSLSSIAKRLKRSKDAVRRNLIQNGISMRPPTNSQEYKSVGKKDKWRTHPPYGFLFLKGKLVPHPVEAENIHEIIKLRKSGRGLREISSYFNIHKIPTRNKKVWGHSLVGNILQRIQKKEFPYHEMQVN